MNNRPTIIITGSTGLVGSGLVPYFSQRGFIVRAFQRKKPEHPLLGVHYHLFNLADVKDSGFEGVDYIIHCAYRPTVIERERELGINIDIEGTREIVALARKHNVRVIFLSTLSAHPDSITYYGKSKFIAERLHDPHEDLILKLGIVLGGKGGLFGRVKASLLKFKIVPLIGSGQQKTQTVALDDLCRVIEIGMEKHIVGTYAIAHPSVILMKDLYRGIARRIGVKPIFIPVPIPFAYHLTRFAERIGIRLPFTSQSILGLQDLRTVNTLSDLAIFGVTLNDCQTSLSQLLLDNESRGK